MKTLGLIGGISWESTTHYYQLLNRGVRERLGGKHSAKLLLWSFDFAPVAKLQEEAAWDELTIQMIDAAKRLEGAGAEALIICANTMHLMADQVQHAFAIPIIHIVDVTCAAIKARHVQRPLLLATRYTMEHPFYAERMDRNDVTPLIPEEADRAMLQSIIFDELVQGKFLDASRQKLIDLVKREQAARGADGVILGCTEFGMLAPPATFDIPAFDSAEEHVRAALDFALST